MSTLSNEHDWAPESYTAGTVIVRSQKAGWPHYYVYGPSGGPATYQAIRHARAADLSVYLNVTEAEWQIWQPEWMQQLQRTSDRSMQGWDGSIVQVQGPMREHPAGSGNWFELQGIIEVNRRKWMMDLLDLSGGRDWALRDRADALYRCAGVPGFE